MSTSNKKQVKVQFPLRRSIIWSVRIMIVIVLLLTATQLVLNVYSDEIIGSILKKYVEIKSRKLYTLNFKECKLNFLGGELTFNEIYLLPDPFEFNKRQKGNNPDYGLLEIYVPYAKVNGSGLKAIIGNKSLQVSDLEISKPYIKYISYHPKPLINKTKTWIGSAFNFGISNQLEMLQIENGSIHDGKFHLVVYAEDTIHEAILNNINIELSDLVADSLSVGTFYHALSIEDLIFSMDNNKIDLPNSPYFINIGNLTYSSAGRKLNIKGLEMERENKAEVPSEDRMTIDYVRIAALDLKNIDLKKLVVDREVFIDEMILKEPESYIILNAKKRLKQSNKDAYKALFKVINSIKINEIGIESAHINLDQSLSGRLRNVLKVDDISMNLDNLLIDTASYSIRKPRFFIDDFNLHSGNQVINFPESIKEMSLAGIQISSFDNSINISGLNFSIDIAEESSTFNADIIIPELVFRELDIWKAINDKKLKAERIILNDIIADIRIIETVSENDTSSIIDDNKSASRLEAIAAQIENLELNHANLNVAYQKDDNSHFLNIKDFNSILTQVHYDSTYFFDSLDFPLFDRFDFELYDMTYLLNDSSMFVFCGGFTGENNLSNIDLLSLNYIDKNGITLDFRELELSGFSVSAFLVNKQIKIENLVLDQPAIQIKRRNREAYPEEDKKLIRKLPFSIDILNSSIDNGSIKLLSSESDQTLGSLDEFSFCVKEFHADSTPISNEQGIFSFHDLSAMGSGIHFRAINNTHEIRVSDIYLSVLDSVLSINDIVLNPQQESSNAFQARIKTAKVNKIDILGMLNSKDLTIPEILLDDPAISIIKLSTNNDGLVNMHEKQKNNSPLLIENIWLQSIGIINGSLEFKDNSIIDGQYLFLDKVNTFIHNLVFDETFVQHPEQFLFSTSISFKGEQLLYQTPGHEFTFKLEDIYISSFDSIITGSNFHMFPRNYGPETVSLEIYTPEVSVSGMDFFNLVDTRTLNTDRILLHNPEVLYVGKKSTDFNSENVSKDFGFKLGTTLNEININRIEIPNGQLTFNESNTSGSGSNIIENVNIDISDIQIDNEMKYKSPFAIAGNIAFTMKGIEVPLASPNYSVNVGDIEFSSLNKALSVRNIELIPFAGKTEFGKHFEYQVSWMNMKNGNIDINGINLEEALNGSFIAKKITISDTDLEIYKDKNPPFDESKAPLLPISAIKNVPFTIIIDTVEVDRAQINYDEFAEFGQNPGSIVFNDLSARILNVTNDSLWIQESRFCLASAHTMLMGTGEVNVNFEFDLSSKDDHHRINGTLNRMDLKDMNNFMENAAFAKITGGKNNGMSFFMDLNKQISKGIMRFNYDDLKVTFIDKKSSKTGVDEAMGAFVANTFILKKANPRYLLLRKGNIYFYRDTKRGVISYWVNSLLSGIKSSVGLKVNQKKIDKKELSRVSNLK